MATKVEVIAMQMMIINKDKTILAARERDVMSILFQLYSSGLAKLVDFIINSSFPKNFCLYGSSGIQHKHLLSLYPIESTNAYFLHMFTKANFAFRFRK